MSTLHLKGLRHDNLLAFMALLGLLRALETARPNWKPRVAWQGRPPHPVLVLAAEDIDEDAVIDAAVEGIAAYASAFDFGGHKDIKFAPDKFRGLLEKDASNKMRLDLLATLASEANVKKGNSDEIKPTPLCTCFGQGHQHFLERLSLLIRKPPDHVKEQIRKAVFQTWRYDEVEKITLRWDPDEDRRYALRFGDPGNDTTGTMPGAYRLAALGIISFPCLPSSGEMKTVGFSRTQRKTELTWPIWSQPAELAAIEALLTHPGLGQKDLEEVGVIATMRALSIHVGKFINFERARQVT